jgi:hypothetical protein
MTDTSSSAISTEGLIDHYGDVRALVDLDLEIRCGEVLIDTTTPRAPRRVSWALEASSC